MNDGKEEKWYASGLVWFGCCLPVVIHRLLLHRPNDLFPLFSSAFSNLPNPNSHSPPTVHQFAKCQNCPPWWRLFPWSGLNSLFLPCWRHLRFGFWGEYFWALGLGVLPSLPPSPLAKKMLKNTSKYFAVGWRRKRLWSVIGEINYF